MGRGEEPINGPLPLFAAAVNRRNQIHLVRLLSVKMIKGKRVS